MIKQIWPCQHSVRPRLFRNEKREVSIICKQFACACFKEVNDLIMTSSSDNNFFEHRSGLYGNLYGNLVIHQSY